MNRIIATIFFIASIFIFNAQIFAQATQWVEGFDTVKFHYDANRSRPVLDFRGWAKGYMTAGWWAPGQMKKNTLSWKTAIVPAKKPTTFAFIGSYSVMPAEITEGPSVRVTVNGQYALTFTLGKMRDYTWQEGGYELKYISKRVEFPYFGGQREFELNGNSGIYELKVPTSVVVAGKAAVIQVEILPFERWHNGWFMVKEHRDVLQQTMKSLEGEITSLRNDMNRVNEQTDILATKLYSKMLGNDKFHNEVIYTDGYHHLHPADLIPLQDGEILLTCREATEHFANDGDVILLRSKDDGKTWGDKQVIAGIKHLDEREGCGVQLRDGTIVVGVFYNNNYTPDGTYNWDSKGQSASEYEHSLPKLKLGTYILRSKDNGHTWSKPDFIDIKRMPFSAMEGPTDVPIQISDGSILMGVIGYGLHGDPKNIAAVMLRSTDEGQTWQYYSTIASDPGGKLGGFLEPGIVRTKSGRIVAGLRNSSPEGAIYITYSDDDGKTWVTPMKTEMIGHPVDIIQLSDGRLMASYGIRPGRHTQPGGIRACFSSDNGKTWDINTEVQLRSDFLNWDIGYPHSMELPDGKVLTAYYFNLFGKYFIGGTFWEP